MFLVTFEDGYGHLWCNLRVTKSLMIKATETKKHVRMYPYPSVLLIYFLGTLAFSTVSYFQIASLPDQLGGHLQLSIQ